MSKTGPRSGRGHPQSPWFRLGVVAVGGGAEGLPLPLFSLHPLHICQGTRGGEGGRSGGGGTDGLKIREHAAEMDISYLKDFVPFYMLSHATHVETESGEESPESPTG